MHRIDTAGATIDNKFQERNPQTGQPGTKVGAAWLTELQEELVGIVLAAGLGLVKGNEGQILQALNLLYGGGVGGGYGNAIANGDFNIWQRGSGVPSDPLFTITSTPLYTADRWLASGGSGGSPSVSVRRQAFTVGQTDVPGEPQYYLEFEVTAPATTTSPTLSQRMEDVRRFAGQTVTVSFYAWLETGTKQMTPRLVQNFGTGGSGAVTTQGDLIQLTDTPTRFTMQFAVPGISGKTLGTNPAGDPDHYLALELPFPTSDTGKLRISRVQIEQGNNASTFEARPFSVELALCQRYFEKSWGYRIAPSRFPFGGYAVGKEAGTNAYPLNTRFKVEKRTPPDITWYPDTNSTPNVIFWGGGEYPVGNTFATGTGQTGWPLIGPSQSDTQCSAHWIADAEL